MYHTNASYKEKVLQFPQDYKMSVDVVFDESAGLDNLTIPPEDIFESDFDESAFGVGKFTIGSAAVTCSMIRIYNPNGKYNMNALSSAEFHPKFTLYDNETGAAVDTVPVGVYYTERINILNSDLKLDCVDKMDSMGGRVYTVQNTKRSLYEISIEIASHSNANFVTTPGQLSLLSKIIDDDILAGYSERQVAAVIAAACGSFAIYNYDGNLEYKWFTESGVELRGDWAKKAISLNGNTFSVDGNPVKVTGVNILSADTVLAFAGTTDYVLDVRDNPVAEAYPQETAEFILNRLKDTVYIPCRWERVGGDPSLQVGDILTIIDNKETYDETKADSYDKYKLFISQKNWKYNSGGFSDIYDAGGYSPQSANKGLTQSKLVSQLRKQIKDIKQGITTGLDDRLTALLLFNEKMYASMGLHMTTADDGHGGTITYLHDETELENSMTIYKMAASGFAWTNSGWNDGLPIWTSGISDNGDAILNQIFAYVVNADLIKTGLLKSQSGGSWINMNSGDFQFAHCDEWIDLDTGEIEYGTPKPVLKLIDGELRIDGKLTNISQPYYSAQIGRDEKGDGGAFTVTDTNVGNIFQTYMVAGGGEEGAIWTAPFTLNGDGTNRKGVSIFPNLIELFADGAGSEARLRGQGAMIGTAHDTLRIGFRESPHPDNMWINYWDAPGNYYAPHQITIGNGTEGGLADVTCGRIRGGDINANNVWAEADIWSGGNISADGGIFCNDHLLAEWYIPPQSEEGMSIGLSEYPLYLFGKGIYANGYIVNSDPNLKENIVECNVNALEKLMNVKFFSYDYKKIEDKTITANQFNSSSYETKINEISPMHVGIGTMANDAPEEIQSADGKGIDLYPYTSFIAKAVQEQQIIIEQLKTEIKILKDEIAELKKK